MKTVRIHKFLSQMGIASRRKAEILINEKRIKINGKFAQIGQKISDLDVVEFDGQKINKKPKIVWYALNKPKNYITSRTDPQNRPIIMEFFDKNSYLFPVGRLDFETTGLILVTNDGETSNKLLHPSSKIQRTYLVKTDFNLNDEEINFLNNNEIYLDNVKSIQKVQKVASRTYIVKVWQGSNHHVKKIFISVSKKVLMLRRLSFATIELGNLKPGEKRKLSQAEILSLKNIF
ncbi:pseudouridine synthase [Mesomycoplasma ovipneumoniae]|uniref:pseudouridine synthase n=1 Tax=Mesomycoplasma ovipneumoniae TaxID=29562 RepID=UPI00083E73ED|nr:pseudouridine synthase [Mesomycoplasma ovipneumoniae]MCN0158268.1 rRNA pseudouridine synthase [Mesomycoplasma ovipneumoniae]MDO6857030.1 pseudouridine synthase [Mesomycoplasma ovipneumoniae]WDV48767.1 pseudouridine synthase [Mesomycoplasma ovipneumoniae ATCC 29419]